MKSATPQLTEDQQFALRRTKFILDRAKKFTIDQLNEESQILSKMTKEEKQAYVIQVAQRWKRSAERRAGRVLVEEDFPEEYSDYLARLMDAARAKGWEKREERPMSEEEKTFKAMLASIDRQRRRESVRREEARKQNAIWTV